MNPSLLPLSGEPLLALTVVDSVLAALAKARASAVHHFSVCHRGRVVGMVCACELEHAAPERMVGEVMHPAVMLPRARSAAEAAMLMQAARVGSVLVTGESGEPVGVVTRADVGRDPVLAAQFERYRCSACGALHHLHQRGEGRACLSCTARTPGARLARSTNGESAISIGGE